MIGVVMEDDEATDLGCQGYIRGEVTRAVAPTSARDVLLGGVHRILDIEICPLGERNQAGSILNTGSVLGFSPSPTYFATHAYAATKAAIEAKL